MYFPFLYPYNTLYTFTSCTLYTFAKFHELITFILIYSGNVSLIVKFGFPALLLQKSIVGSFTQKLRG